MSNCDPAANIVMRLDPDERFVDFDFYKIACGSPIASQCGFREYCAGRHVADFMEMNYSTVIRDLNVIDEEQQFVVFLEWDALRCAIAKYLGSAIPGADPERCQIIAIKHEDSKIEISEVILPPQNLPAINTYGTALEKSF